LFVRFDFARLDLVVLTDLFAWCLAGGESAPAARSAPSSASSLAARPISLSGVGVAGLDSVSGTV
jgi:hypothetical protein